MKRRDLLKHLKNHGCTLLREGGSHSIWKNPDKGLRTAIPRHREINDYTAKRICEQLDVPPPN
ncbi:MAG: type II toxin-antitoxin system HicA family toxin [Acidobacteriota bacterium]